MFPDLHVEAIAPRINRVAVPLAGFEPGGRGLCGSGEAAGEKTGWLKIPDLQFVTCDVRLPFFFDRRKMPLLRCLPFERASSG